MIKEKEKKNGGRGKGNLLVSSSSSSFPPANTTFLGVINSFVFYSVVNFTSFKSPENQTRIEVFPLTSHSMKPNVPAPTVSKKCRKWNPTKGISERKGILVKVDPLFSHSFSFSAVRGVRLRSFE